MWKQILSTLIPSVVHALAALLDLWADRQTAQKEKEYRKGETYDLPDIEGTAAPAHHHRSPGSHSAPLCGDYREEP